MSSGLPRKAQAHNFLSCFIFVNTVDVVYTGVQKQLKQGSAAF